MITENIKALNATGRMLATVQDPARRVVAVAKDPTGRRRAAARRRMLVMAGVGAVGVIAGMVAALRLIRSRRRGSPPETPATPSEARAASPVRTTRAPASASTLTAPATAGARASTGGTGSPLDHLAERTGRTVRESDAFASGAGDHHEPNLGFGVSGSIPAGGERVGDAMPTGGGDALGSTLSGRGQAGAEQAPSEIMTGAGEAMTNTTTSAGRGRAARGDGANMADRSGPS